MLDFLDAMQVRDEGPHQPGFPDTGGESEAEGWKIAFEVINGGEFGFEYGKLFGEVSRFIEINDFTDTHRIFSESR